MVKIIIQKANTAKSFSDLFMVSCLELPYNLFPVKYFRDVEHARQYAQGCVIGISIGYQEGLKTARDEPVLSNFIIEDRTKEDNNGTD